VQRFRALIFLVAIGILLATSLSAQRAVAEQEFTADELEAASLQQKELIAAAQEELLKARKQLKAAVASRDKNGAVAARASIDRIEQTIRDLRKREVATFAADRREEIQRDEAEQKAAKAAAQAREQAIMEVMRRPKIQPDTMKDGDEGFFQSPEGREYLLRVYYADEKGVVASVYGSRHNVVVAGVDSSALVSDRFFSLPQRMKVAGTQQFAIGGVPASYFVIVPADPADKAVVMREAPSTQVVPPPLTGRAARVPAGYMP
jgi:hypothetical protein